MCEVLRTNNVKTRKRHQCLLCLRYFDSGSTMENQVGIQDNEIYSIYICSTCQSLIPYFMEDVDELSEGFTLNDMAENNKETPEELLEYYVNTEEIQNLPT